MSYFWLLLGVSLTILIIAIRQMLLLSRSISAKRNILLYDGECGLCDRFVNFIISNDPEGRIKFASQQSEVGTSLLHQHGFSVENGSLQDTIVLISGEDLFVYSTAILRSLIALGGFWSLSALFLLIPLIIRDTVYDIVAHYRTRFFRKVEELPCARAPVHVRARFLDLRRPADLATQLSSF